MSHAVINGIDLHYHISGQEDGPPLLFSNSLASTLNMWDPQMPAFEAHYKVIRYDSRGHGKSSAPDGPYSIEMLVDDAIALLDHLGIAKTDFCGLSKGGMVGQRLATLHPERVDRLVLCDTGCYMGPPEMWEGRIATAGDQGMGAVVDATIQRWFTPAFQKSDPDAVAKVHQMIVNTPVAGFIGCCRAIQAMDQRDTIQAITAPTLVVVGADDPGTTPDAAREIHKRIAGSALEILPDAAHLSNIEQQALFDRTVLGFLGKA